MILGLSLVSLDFDCEGMLNFITPFQHLLKRSCDFHLDSDYILVCLSFFLSFFNVVFLIYVNSCMCVCGFVHVSQGVHGNQF